MMARLPKLSGRQTTRGFELRGGVQLRQKSRHKIVAWERHEGSCRTCCRTD